MHGWTLKHVSMWLEGPAAHDVAFAHAQQWAFRLQVPLRLVAVSYPSLMDTIKPWCEIAARRGITLETHLTLEKTTGAIEQFLHGNGLCLFTNTPGEQDLLRQASQIPALCQLHCASPCTSMERVLVLCRAADLGTAYLENAAGICQTLETTPLVLILAESEDAAEMKCAHAANVFRSRRMFAEVDFVIDRDPGQAVQRVVSWRRCGHVILSRAPLPSDRLSRDLAMTASVLSIPADIPLELPRRIQRGHGVFPWSLPAVSERGAAIEYV